MNAPLIPLLRLALVRVLALVLVGRATERAEAAAPEAVPLQGAALLKTDLLGVFAHPDDETGMAGTIARYALGEHRAVAHVYVTRGEGGGNMVGTQAGPALGILREAELRQCLAILGVRACSFLEQEDFFYTESHAATLRKWNRDEALAKLVRIVRALRPEVIVTMNPAPNPGQHGHHQAAGVLATEAFSAAADPTRFPAQLTVEGLAPWQARKLYYGGASGGAVATIDTTQPDLDGRTPAEVAGDALSHHRSQGFGSFANSPWLRRPQTFTLALSTVRPLPNSTHLFEGLPAPEPVRPIEFAPAPSLPPVSILPRPAIRRFLAWASTHRVRHAFANFAADVPVVAGEAATVFLQVPGQELPGIVKTLQVHTEAGWPVDIADSGASPGVLHPVPITLNPQVPADATNDTTLEAVARIGGQEIVATARLHPVPLARIPRTGAPLPLEGEDPRWEGARILQVGPERTWQGSATNAADCSATLRILHDGQALELDIRVRDDVVVSNIAPDDIRGHWRSDSVEICLDPAGGAEDTTGCFKLGIFPFDTTGRVRAARDADARQGPVETTAPGVQLASRRTPDGYRIRARIPLDVVLGPGTRPGRLGFNVLVYDGDKAGAAPGENINECRLAWSPRAGVQGRPEDWGRIDLE